MLPHYGILCFELEIAGFHKLQVYFTGTQQETNKWLDDGDGKSSKFVPNFFFIKTPNALDGGGKVRCRSSEGGCEELSELCEFSRERNKNKEK